MFNVQCCPVGRNRSRSAVLMQASHRSHLLAAFNGESLFKFHRIAPATIAAASITASGGALVVVGHGILVGLLFRSP